MLFFIWLGVISCFPFKELLRGITRSRESFILREIIKYSYIFQSQVILPFYGDSEKVSHPGIFTLKKIILDWFIEETYHGQLFRFETYLMGSSEGLVSNLISYPPNPSAVRLPIGLKMKFSNPGHRQLLSLYLGCGENDVGILFRMRGLLFEMSQNDTWIYNALEKALFAWKDFLKRHNALTSPELKGIISNFLTEISSLKLSNADRINGFIYLYVSSLEGLLLNDHRNFGNNLNSLILVLDLIIYFQNVARIFHITDTTNLQTLHVEFIRKVEEFSEATLNLRLRLWPSEPFSGKMCINNDEKVIVPHDMVSSHSQAGECYPLTTVTPYYFPFPKATPPSPETDKGHIAYFYCKKIFTQTPDPAKSGFSFELIVYTSNKFLTEAGFETFMTFIKTNVSNISTLNKPFI
jgi:hypothetical protein